MDEDAGSLARRALVITLTLAAAGACLGVLGFALGVVVGIEAYLALVSLLFSCGILGILFLFRRVELQALATISTCFFTLNLCVGILVAGLNGGELLNLFVYLMWFFPLVIFNRLVNRPAVGRLLAIFILIAPAAILLVLLPRLRSEMPVQQQVLLGVFTLAYSCCALTIQLVTRYREKYIVEREHAELLKTEAGILESISDAFVSLDSRFGLVYMNDAACAELAVSRQTALNTTLWHAAPGFFSAATIKHFQEASRKPAATFLECRNEVRGSWHEFRCFPRADGLSIYFRNINRRKSNEERIHKLAFYDVLTGLPNRQLVHDRWAAAQAKAVAEGSTGVLLSMDLDDFRTLNNTMGQETGDALLQQVALRLASVFEGDLVARLGGDEFVVILATRSPDAETARAVATLAGERLLGMFGRPFELGTYESKGTVSIGATLFGDARETVDQIFKQADLALHRAKAEGGNGMRFFETTMQTAVDERAALRSDLRHALLRGEFEVHYQPQVDWKGIVTGSEALLRWFHPTRGSVSPTVFISLAEEAGLIAELGRWVLEKACLQLVAWSGDPVMAQLSVAVNVSVRQFFGPRFVNVVMETVAATGAPPEKLKLEITESSLMDRVDEVSATMEVLRACGIRFSLDDFGTGYSSLSYLRHLPLDQLKIDRSFVRDVLTDPKHASIARSIIVLARSLNLSVIAEGVETEAQRDFLLAEGCESYQGFLYSRALSAERFEAFVAERRELLVVPFEAFRVDGAARTGAVRGSGLVGPGVGECGHGEMTTIG